MPAPRNILGLSAYYHDAAAAVVVAGRIVAAAQEERFTRRKNDSDFPALAVPACLRQARLTLADLDAVVFYDKPVLKFARLLETYLAVAPGGWRTFPPVMTNWLGEKLDLRKAIRAHLPGLRPDCEILFTQHHQAHAASAFYPSPFDEAAILTIDGVGEWATTTDGPGPGPRNRTAPGNPVSPLAGAAVLGVHGLLRFPHQFRRIQADGPGALWRTRICRSHPPATYRSPARRFLPPEPGLFQFSPRYDHDQ